MSAVEIKHIKTSLYKRNIYKMVKAQRSSKLLRRRDKNSEKILEVGLNG